MELHDVFKKVKKPVAARITVSENIVGLVSHYYSTPVEEGGPKRLKTITEITQQYAGLIDVPAARVQALNEIRFTEGRRVGEFLYDIV